MSETKITRKDALLYGGAAAGGLVVGGGAVAGVGVAVEGAQQAPAGAGEPIVARYVAGELPVTDPDAGAWRDARRVLVPLVAQQIAQPYLDKAGVGELYARALHNGAEVALLLEWDDDSVGELDGIPRY